MAEILSACTGMSVRQVNDATELRPDCVYVIPPDRELVIDGDSVTAREFTEPRGRRAPIDMFFRSVAAARGDGMGVVLTGAGSDGSSGVRAIHEAGGVVLAQDPEEAEFPAMPQNAITTGVVSFVEPVSHLAERIAQVARSKQAVRSLDEARATDDLRNIVGFLRDRTGHDFSSYKRTTVMRRVLRRMQISRIASMSAYSEFVRDRPEEAQELFNDLLISVTLFFRDEPSFEALATKAVRPMFDDVGSDGLRIWSAGCATGEEAYSLAILMLEEMERRQARVPVQIFASDLDEAALATAREARYPRSIQADVSEERLARFFVDEGTHYRIRQEVRDLVLFTSHSVLKDPPFLRLDLIACRNLLIYLERSLQEQLLNLFSYALRPQGYLFLGSAETADDLPDLLTPVDREARLYRAGPRLHRKPPVLPHVPAQLGSRATGSRAAPARARGEAPEIHHQIALEQAAPPSVLVDEAQQIVHLSPAAGRFIQHSGGMFSGKLAEVVQPELRLDLKIALDKALERKLPSLTVAARATIDGGPRRVAMHVSPVSGAGGLGTRALVVFLDAGPVDPEEEAEETTAGSETPDVRRLSAELRQRRKRWSRAAANMRARSRTCVRRTRNCNPSTKSTGRPPKSSRRRRKSFSR